MKQLFLSKSNNPDVEVQIHDYQHNATGLYVYASLKGFFSPTIRYSGQDRAGRTGHITTGQKYGARALPLRGFIAADTITDYNTAVEALSSILVLEEDSYGRPVPMILRCVSDTNREYSIDVVLREEPELPEEFLLFGEFSLPLIAPDPLFRQLPQIVSGQLDISQNLGALIPPLSPFRLGTTHGSQLTLYNDGNLDVYPYIRIHGQLTNPIIINNTTNKYYKLNYTFQSGTTGSLNMAENEARSGSTNINTYRGSGSTAWPLVKGANSLALQTSNDSDDGYVTFEYHNLRTNVR